MTLSVTLYSWSYSYDFTVIVLSPVTPVIVLKVIKLDKYIYGFIIKCMNDIFQSLTQI